MAAGVCPKCGAEETIEVAPAAADATLTAGASSIGALSPRPEVPGYTILDELGRGGMGVVYRARESSLNRLVALKVLLSGAHASPRDLARFRTEAEAAAAVQHPNVVQVFSVGQHAGLPYMAQEFVGGGSLVDRLAKGAFHPDDAARTVQGTARGVQAAHDRGVVHRDLKPANVLFGPTGQSKVADFGLAKIGDTGLTASGAIMGTPSYMAPEQARGETKAAGPAADIWALGVILYECLTGKPPFRGQSAPDTLRLVCEAEPPALRGVPKDLATIAMKCLEKEPSRRYGSAGAVADELGRFLAGEPVTARPRGMVTQIARWVGRNKAPVYIGAGAVVTAAIVIAIFLPTTADSQPTTIAKQPPPLDPEDEHRPKKEGVVGKVEESARRMNSLNNIRQLSIGAHNMHSTFDRLPPNAIYDEKTGQPLLSWRVAYLPFMEEGELYKQFRLNEPWDSPHNIKLLDKMPKYLQVQGSKAPAGHTHYQLVTGPGTMFDPGAMKPGQPFGKVGMSFVDVIDGTAYTILMIESAKAVPWTKPADFEVAPDRPLPALGGTFEGGFCVGMADGRVYFVSDQVSEKTLRAAFTPRGSDPIGTDWPYGPGKSKMPKE
jgi:serine/threonine protein kinase